MSETRHRHITSTHTVRIPTDEKGVSVIPYAVEHFDKVNHSIYGNFTVTQPDSEKVYDVKFYVLTESQLINWLITTSVHSDRFKSPKDSVVSLKATTSGQYNLEIKGTAHVYFVFNNRFSTWTSKNVTITINEEWDEQPLSLDLVTTIPPQDDSIRDQLERIFSKSQSDLKIISPYIDMSFVKIMLQRQAKGVNIQIITRHDPDSKGKDKENALRFIQQHIKANHRANASVHSRIVIRDNEEALISSADLTHDSLLGQFNAGIVVADANVIRKLVAYFDSVWQASISR